MTERLWAPWRMEYILSDKRKGGCVFCGHAASDEREFRRNLVLVATERAFVALNRYPFAAGHLLVVPNRHDSSLTALPEEEADALFRLTREAVRRLSDAVSPEGVNVGMNLGTAAGAGIADHLHVHIVPRWAGDSSFMPVLSDVRIIPEYLDATWTRLAPHFADIPGRHAAPSSDAP